MTHKTVSENRMRERISMKSKMLGALALLTLIGALFVMQSAATSTPTVNAAAGSIDALNVGTCLTTSTDVFGEKDCTALDDRVEGRDIRDKYTEVETLYATYAHDPKTASDEPRAILMDSDLLKISITDSGRDKRSGVLIKGASTPDTIAVNGVGTNNTDNEYIDDDASGSLGEVISEDLGDDFDYERGDPDLNTAGTTAGEDDDIKLTHGDASATVVHIRGTPTASIITNSGNVTLNFSRDATNGDPFNPGDFDVDNGAVVRFYGCLVLNDATACDADSTAGTDDDPRLLNSYLTVDEDTSNGEAAEDTAPWLGVNASVPNDSDILILAVYYRTSNQEDLVGGQAYRHCGEGNPGPTRDNDNAWECASGGTLGERNSDVNVDYTDNEKANNTGLKVEASADGDTRSVNLYLTETERFNGVYQGYLRLTDADGDGRIHSTDGATPDNWGLEVGDGVADVSSTRDIDESIAVLGVESGPVTITYRDSDDNTQSLRIEIDNRAPSINIASPADGSSSNDRSPDFAGSFEDPDSGLVDRSFRLVVDNWADNNAGTNSDFALGASTWHLA